jgi:hypothetical protein
LAGVAAARTTQSCFPAFLASTNPSDVDIDNGGLEPGDPARANETEYCFETLF